jgi:hypothetical protein
MHKRFLALGICVAVCLPFMTHAATPTQAVRAIDVLNRFGINTHIDFQNYGYQNLSQTALDINYLGNGQIKILRDSPGSSQDLAWWPQLAAATHAKFDAYIGEGAPSIYASELSLMQQMRAGAYLMGVEGGNEEDDSYPTSLENTQQLAAQFQPTLFTWAQSVGLPTFNISFGSGWCGPQDPNCLIGDYGTVGDLSSSATYGNAHTYPQYSPQSTGAFANLNHDATLAASSRPVAITEFGWTTNNPGGFGNVSETTQAAYTLEGILDAYQLGNPYYFYYALYDDASGAFGLFKTSNQPKVAAKAMHNFFALLGDTGTSASSFTPTALSYSLSGMPASNGISGGKQLLLQKSDGSYWLALWNEQSLNTASGADVSVTPVPVTLTLDSPASIEIYDPLVSTNALQTTSGANITVNLPAHPILVHILNSSTPLPTPAPAPAPTPVSTVSGRIVVTEAVNVRTSPSTSSKKLGHQAVGNTGTIVDGPISSGGYTWLQISYDAAPSGWSAAKYLRVLPATPIPVPPPISTPTPTPVVIVPNIPPVDTPVIHTPTNFTATAGSATTVSGISIQDPFAALNPGQLAFDASAQNGTLTLSGATGSGSPYLTYAATLAQINGATLRYTPNTGATSDTITITVYNQAGISTTKSIPVIITVPATPISTPIPTPTDPILLLPTSLSTRIGVATAVTGVSVTDPFAARNPGLMALRISANSGTLAASNMTGSGTNSLSLDGTLNAVNSALASLTYTARQAGVDTIFVSIWNQAGLHTDKTISVTASNY